MIVLCRFLTIAPEITCFQATCATQAPEPSSDESEQLSSEPESLESSEPAEGVHSRLVRGDPTAPSSEEAVEIIACLLLALQQELTQLTRTPSMQLLAQQQIPRLEEAIKHLIASLSTSA